MGLRFRRSIKIAPGLKLNLNKKSIGITAGTRGAHYTINSKGKKTASVGIPGTGLSYTTSSGGNSSPKSATSSDSGSTEKGNGCSGCLSILLIIFLIGLAIGIFSYAWIAGLGLIIYFALSKKFERKEKTKLISIAAIISVISLFVFGAINSESELTELNASIQETVYSIDDSAEVLLTLTPSDAAIESLEISDNDIVELAYTDEKAIISFKDEGTATVYFIANGEVESNSIEITVVDEDDEELETSKDETIEEDETQINEDVKTEDTPDESEPQQSENSQGNESADTQKETPSVAPVVVPEETTPTEQQKPETSVTTKPEEPTQTETSTPTTPQEEMVWIPNSGSKYHSREGCSNMENPTQVTKSEAEALGFEPCKRCY